MWLNPLLARCLLVTGLALALMVIHVAPQSAWPSAAVKVVAR